MSSVRNILTVVVLIALTGGYLGSQAAFMNGTTAEWASRMDQPTIALVALAFGVLMLVLAAIRENEAETRDR